MRDAILGLGFIVLGVITISIARQFPTMPSLQYGPSLFPSLIGGGFIIGGLVLVVSRLPLLKRQLGRARSGDAMAIDYRAFLMASLPGAMIVFYILASESLGAALCLAMIMFLLMLLRKAPLPLALAVSITASLVVYLIFSRYLLIPLPEGLLSVGR